ncbi:DUF6522 family protein [Bosea sp. 2YAB26]|uniref:DUF6522 family protein n=1 Tax=Bosea sp. 2YAB26 TaxID=3237478 RepID=UPI003F8E6BDF
MQIVRDDAGDITMDAAVLSGRLGMSNSAMRQLMRRGLVHSRVEVGIGEDAGRCRLALRCGNRIWQAVLGPEGQIESEELRYLRASGTWINVRAAGSQDAIGNLADPVLDPVLPAGG